MYSISGNSCLFLTIATWIVGAIGSPHMKRDDPPVTIQTRRNTYNCDAAPWMKAIEAQAWADAGALADEAVKWKAGGKYQPAMDLYMGKNSVDKKYKGTISTSLSNEQKAHNPNSIFPEAVISVYCGDKNLPKKNGVSRDGKICTKYRNGQLVKPFATSWVDRGKFWNDYYIVFCPRFFAEKDSLYHTLSQMSYGSVDKNNGSAYKFTWGHTYYHELMHLDPVVAVQETWDPAYGACNVADLAAKNGCEKKSYAGGQWSSLLNADSWAQFASTTYFQAAFSLPQPGQPDCGYTKTYDEENPESYWESDTQRDADSFNAQSPPDPPASANPDGPAPTPALPYDSAAAVPNGVAMPFPDAEEFFASLGNSPSDSPSSAAPPATSTPPPQPSPSPEPSSPPARTCDIDCGSELPPPGRQPICFCVCSDHTSRRILNSSPPCK